MKMKKFLKLMICMVLSTTMVYTCVQTEVVEVEAKKQKVVVIDAGHQAKGNNAKEPIGPRAKTKKAKVTTGTKGKWSKKKESEITL